MNGCAGLLSAGQAEKAYALAGEVFSRRPADFAGITPEEEALVGAAVDYWEANARKEALEDQIWESDLDAQICAHAQKVWRYDKEEAQKKHESLEATVKEIQAKVSTSIEQHRYKQQAPEDFSVGRRLKICWQHERGE